MEIKGSGIMILSEPQKKAIEQIRQLVAWRMETLHIPEEHCWFTQGSLKHVTWKTLQVLRSEGYLIERCRYDVASGEHYLWVGKGID